MNCSTPTKEDCGAIADDGVTYAALILFGKPKSVARYLPQAEIIFEYRSKESAGPAAQREEFCEGFFIQSYNRVWKLVNLRNDNQHYQDHFAVLPVPTFNERVVREALLNAIAHRDYQLGGSVFVRQYSRRIVIQSPGGFPYGITVDNMLDKQSARNKLIANIFMLCGLVERSGQGMNMMFEMAVKEAKPLPDFSGSDPYFVELTLNGKVIDVRMLAFVKKIGDDLLEAMTTDDYTLLAAMYDGKGIAEIDLPQFGHLLELGIVKQTQRGLEPANGDLALLIDQNGALPIDSQSIANRQPIDSQSIETIDSKKRIAELIKKNGKVTSSQLAKLTGLTPGRVRQILQQLVADGFINKVGDYRYAAYALKNDNE